MEPGEEWDGGVKNAGAGGAVREAVAEALAAEEEAAEGPEDADLARAVQACQRINGGQRLSPESRRDGTRRVGQPLCLAFGAPGCAAGPLGKVPSP